MFVKKILISLFVIGVVSVASIGATRAYFTDSYTVTDNTFAAGTLSFDIRGHGGDFPDEGIPVDASGMVPGEVDTTYFEVYNHANSIDMKYYLYTRRTGGNVNLYNMLRYRLYKCDNPVSGPDLCTTWVYRKSGWLKDLTDSNFATPHDNDVAPNGTHRWRLDLWLDSGAGDYYQGKSATFELTGFATQESNPGWSE